MCHVLIIEDEAFIAMEIEMILEAEGASSFAFAATEEEAVACARAQRPGLIISDVTLLEGLGPIAVQRIISEAGPLPVIFITGTPESCTPRDPESIVLTKPVTRKTLIRAYHGSLDESR